MNAVLENRLAGSEASLQDAAKMASCLDFTTHGRLLDAYGVTMTPEDAGNVLHLHPSTVRRLCQSGVLPGRKVGKSWVLPTVKLADYLEGGEANGE